MLYRTAILSYQILTFFPHYYFLPWFAGMRCKSIIEGLVPKLVSNWKTMFEVLPDI
jgi:hypothetical protein